MNDKDSQAGGTRPKKILVVDDNEVILKALSLRLTSKGFQVSTATDGAAAVSVARKEKPDLIVLDISFPPDLGIAWDGFSIMEWLRRTEESKDTPIIIITGSEPAKYKDRALALGAAAFFHKPIDHEELLGVIRKTLGQDAGAKPPATGTSFQI
jgi:two-component system alkaline phosphatase synthesis response regulator PhoP